MPRSRPALLAILLLAGAAQAARPFHGGAVATAYSEASAAALEMLNRGGNAVDAAVAAAFVAGVVGPYHNGIGGGGFALVYLAPTHDTLALDFREVAPAAASRDMYLRSGAVDSQLATDGGLAVAVPNAVHGYLALLERAGKLSRSAVLAPAIRLARSGFGVTPQYQDRARARLDCLRANGEAARLFLRPGPDGAPDVPELETLVRQPELARTLERIAAQGGTVMRRGPIAQAIVQSVRGAGGVLALDDLGRIGVRWRKPLVGTYRGYRVATFPPPSAGGLAILEVLGILERLRPNGYSRRAPEDLHLYLEALRRVYAERARLLGDPDQTNVPTARLVSPAHLSELAASIDPNRATPSTALVAANSALTPDAGTSADPGGRSQRKNTTHLSVVDRQGNVVALTSTVNTLFGSCVVAHGTGILLNNEMDDFASKPLVPNTYGLITGEANAIAPGRIPLSSMSPTLVFQKEHPDRVLLALGSRGGSTIPTTVLQVLLNVLDAHMTLPAAVAAGRVHHQWLPDVVMLDNESLEPATLAALERLGHKFQRVPDWALGDAEAVMIDPETGLRTAASDPRNEGAAVGQD
jgi:gamma-glutamyltranspeptidase / glutathione hydrolase